MMNPEDMERLSLQSQSIVDIVSHYQGRERQSSSWKVVPYEIPKGNLAAYFPEANTLVPLESVAEGSNTPTSKSIEVSIVRHKD